MKQKTIINQLFEEIEKHGWDMVKDYKSYYIRKERQQILDSYYDAEIQIIKLKFPEKIERCTNDFKDAEQYYNETYGEEESN